MKEITFNKGETFHAEPSQLEKNLFGVFCPSCKQKTDFEYIGDIKSERIMPFYNCTTCNSTRSFIDIIKYNKKRIS